MWPTWAPRRARRRAPGSDGVQVPAGEGTSRDPAACRPGQQGFRGLEHPAKALSVPHGPRLGTRNHSPGPAPALGRGHLGQPHLAEGLSPPHTAWLWVQVGGGAGPGTRAGSTFVLQHRVRTCGRGGLTQGEGGGAGRGGALRGGRGGARGHMWSSLPFPVSTPTYTAPLCSRPNSDDPN